MIDIKLEIYERLIKAKDFQDVKYYINLLEWIKQDLIKTKDGRAKTKDRKGDTFNQLKQNGFEDSQTSYGLNGTNLAQKVLKNRFGGKRVTQEFEEI
jgi:hypothetical protein